MNRLLGVVMVLALLAGSTVAARATTCNIDWRNTGTTTAYDLALILPTNECITQWYNGTQGCDDVFAATSATQSGGNTILHWTNPATPIPPDAGGSSPQVHVGWTTTDNTCPATITGYWTDQSGNQISGSFVATVVDHLSETSTTGTISIANSLSAAVTISNVRYGVFPAPVTLAQLNRCNAALVANLSTVMSDPVTVKAGDTLNIPVPTCYACNVVVNYEVSGTTLNAVADNWVADTTPTQP